MSGLQEAYKNSSVVDYLDQHLDMETAMLRLQLEHNETLKKFMHHTKLVTDQLGTILSKIPNSITLQDGTVVPIVDKDDTDSLKTMLKQLSVFELTDRTPELERDLYIYAFSHNLINAYIVHNPLVHIHSLLLQILTLQSVQVARAMVELYWEHSPGSNAPDLFDEHGYIWKFIDPNNEVQKISEEDNLTPTQARAKIMQRTIDALYDPTIFESRDQNSTYKKERWFDVLFGYVGNTAVEAEDIYIQGLEKWDPSRFAIKDEESE